MEYKVKNTCFNLVLGKIYAKYPSIPVKSEFKVL